MPPFAVFPDDRMGKKKITWLEERGGEELPPRGQRGQRLPWGGLLGGVREWKDGEGPARPPPALCCHTVFTNDKVLFGDRVSSSCIQLPCRGLLRDLPGPMGVPQLLVTENPTPTDFSGGRLYGWAPRTAKSQGRGRPQVGRDPGASASFFPLNISTLPCSSTLLGWGDGGLDVTCLHSNPGGMVVPVHVSGPLGSPAQAVHVAISDPHAGTEVTGFAHGQGCSLGCPDVGYNRCPSLLERQPHARTSARWAQFQPPVQVWPAQDLLSGPAYIPIPVWIMCHMGLGVGFTPFSK